jgi:hypothetical protein
MAPVVHGLEEQYKGRIDFLYLNVALPSSDSAKRAFGFRATPHFFFLSPSGTAMDSTRGVVAADSLRIRLDRLLATLVPPH